MKRYGAHALLFFLTIASLLAAALFPAHAPTGFIAWAGVYVLFILSGVIRADLFPVLTLMAFPLAARLAATVIAPDHPLLQWAVLTGAMLALGFSARVPHQAGPPESEEDSLAEIIMIVLAGLFWGGAAFLLSPRPAFFAAAGIPLPTVIAFSTLAEEAVFRRTVLAYLAPRYGRLFSAVLVTMLAVGFAVPAGPGQTVMLYSAGFGAGIIFLRRQAWVHSLLFGLVWKFTCFALVILSNGSAATVSPI